MSHSELGDLESALRQAMADGHLALTPPLLADGPLRDFLNSLPGRTLLLSDVELEWDPVRGILDLGGACADRWPIPGMRLSVGAQNLTARFHARENVIEERVLWRAELLLPNGSIPLAGTVFRGGILSFLVTHRDPPEASFADLFGLVGQEESGGMLPTVIRELPALAIADTRVDIVYSTTAPSRVELGCRLDLEIAVPDGTFALRFEQIRFARSFQWALRGRNRSRAGGSLHGNLTIGERVFDGRVALLGRDLLELEVMPRDGDVLPGLTALADLFGGGNGGSQLQRTLDEHGLALIVDDILLRLGARDLAFRGARVGGRLTYDGLTFQVAAQLPDFSFHGRLAPDSPPIKLGELIQRHFGPTVDFPAIDVTALEIGAQPGAGRFSFHVDVRSDFTLQSGPLSLGISRFELSIDKQRDTAATGSGRVTLTLLDGELEGFVSHERAGGAWHFELNSTGLEPINLTDLTSGLLNLFGLPPLPAAAPDLLLDQLQVSFDTGDGPFRIQAETHAPGRLPLAANIHDVHGRVDLLVETDATTRQRVFSGTFEADLQIGTVLFAVQYEFGRETHVFEGAMVGGHGGVSLPELAEALAIPIDGIEIPAQAAVTLRGVAFRYHHEEHTFSLVASTDIGRAFLAAGKPAPEDAWGLVFGVEIDGEGLAALLPAGDELASDALVTSLHLQKLAVVVASRDWPDLRLPELPDHSGSSVDPTGLFAGLTSTTLKLSRGLSALALLDLKQSASGDPRLAHLQRMAGDGSAGLLVQLTFSTARVAIEARLDGGLTLSGAAPIRPDRPGGFALAGAGLLIELRPEVKIEAFGKFLIPVYEDTLLATGRIAVSTRDAHCAFGISLADENGSPAAFKVPGLPGLAIDEVDVELGLAFEPPGLELGLEARFHIGGQQAHANELAFLLDLEGELPNPLLLYARMQELSVELWMDMVGAPRSDLPEVFRKISAEDLMIYWAEGDVELPDGTEAEAGFGIRGLLKIVDFSAFARLSVSADGVSGLAEISPFGFADNAIRVAGGGEGVSVDKVFVNGSWQPEIKRLRNESSTTTALERKSWPVVSAGGPVVSFNSAHSPYLDVDVQLTLLDEIGVTLDVKVTDLGFELDLEARIGDALHASLICELGKDAFRARAQIELDLHGQLGPLEIGGLEIPAIVLDLVVAGDLGIELVGGKLQFQVEGKLEFDGLALELALGPVIIDFDALADLPGAILEQLLADVEKFFGQLIDEVAHTIEEFEAEIASLVDSLFQHERTSAEFVDRIVERLPREAEEIFARAAADPSALMAKAAAFDAEAETLRAEAAAKAQSIIDQGSVQARVIRDRASAILAAAEAEATRIREAAEIECALHVECCGAREHRAATRCREHMVASTREADAIRSGGAWEAEGHLVRARSAAAAMAVLTGQLRDRAALRRETIRIGHHRALPRSPIITSASNPRPTF